MPRQAQFSKEDIITVAFDLLRRNGPESLSARCICKEMGCSVSPLFTVFSNMDEIVRETLKAAEKYLDDYLCDVYDYMPAFKEFGIRMVQFAKKEPKLFQYLFLDKDINCTIAQSISKRCLGMQEKALNLTKEQSDFIYRQMWPFTCGIAFLCNKYPEIYTDQHVSEMLSTEFSSLMMFAKSGSKVENITPHRQIIGK